jgi:hypothetical protein
MASFLSRFASAKKAVGAAKITNPLGSLQSAAEDAAQTAALRSAGVSATDAAELRAATGGVSGFKTFTSSVKGFFSVTLPATGKWFVNGLTFSALATSSQKATVWGIVIVIGLIITGSILYSRGFFNSKPNPPGNAEKTANVLAAKAAKSSVKKEGFQDTPAKAAELTLLTSQPMTIKHAALLNPTMDGTTATMNALKSGFRAFTLQIDYLESAKDGFPAVGSPTLVYRDATGGLLSTNAGSIEDVAKAIATYAFTSESPNSTQPILLYLHIVRAPSQIKEPQKYAKFLGSIATMLNPLAPIHLGMTAMGDFHRQKQEGNLLTMPLSSIAGHVIILCNADTSVAADKSKPANDLDYWVNMRVYSEDGADSKAIGVAQPFSASTGMPAAVVTDLKSLTAMATDKSDAFAIKGKNRFVIAMPDAVANPTPTVLRHGLTACGVNIIPIDIFTVDTDEAVALTEEYKNTSWSQKHAALF